MKFAKLSLAAIVVAGLASSSFAADTLADAFKNGKVSGELRAYYFDRDTGNQNNGTAGKGDASILNTGVVLGYKTASFYGLSLGLTVQSNFAPFANDEAKNLYKKDEYGSGAVLSEAYLAYTIGKTTAKIGRQFISTPLVAGSGSRMIKQAFEGITVVNTDLPQTTLVAGYVDKYQNRTLTQTDSTETGVPEFADVGENGAYTLLAINKSIPGLKITGQWAEVVDSVDLYYAELAYAAKAGSFSYGLAGQYQVTDYDASGKDSSGYYGLKASMGYDKLNAYVAYSKVDKDNDVVSGLGSGTDIIYTGSDIFGGTYKANTKAYAVDLNYAIITNGKIGARYSQTDDDIDADKVKYTNFYASYSFEGALKGFVTTIQYEDINNASPKEDGHELRFKAAYKF